MHHDLSSSSRVRLSQTNLWQYQQDFFQSEGADTWSKKVPFYVTSNPYIANAYAHVIVRFLQDRLRNGRYHEDQTCYIVELGAGVGQFGFYCVKRLAELLETLRLTQIQVVYVMTDITQKNVQFWREHPALVPYVERGLLDFAVYDAIGDTQITLEILGTVLSPSEVAENPMIVLANYVFDTLPQDVFRVEQGCLQEALFSDVLSFTPTAGNQSVSLRRLDPKWEYRDVAWPYYSMPEFDEVLKSYVEQYADQDAIITVPIGSLQALANLRAIAGNDLCVLGSDRGYDTHLDAYTDCEPEVLFHSSFSFLVNFDAIGRYARLCGGDQYSQAMEQGLTTSAFLIGSRLEDLPETTLALETFLESYSPGNVYAQYRHLYDTKTECSLRALLAYFAATQWDPYVLLRCREPIIETLQMARPTEYADIVEALRRIHANVYDADTAEQIAAIAVLAELPTL